MKSKEELIAIGSQTAKNGFQNERDIVEKFNNWNGDEDAKNWLNIMGYRIDEIEKVEAITLHGFKTDVQVKVTIYFKEAIDAQNISIKLVSNPHGFNQIDKRWVNSYVDMWNIPKDVADALKKFTGETAPESPGRDPRRTFCDEMDKVTQEKIVNFFDKNKALIIADIIKGRGKFSADWMMVALHINDTTRWALKDINFALNIFSQGETAITSQGSLKIGRVTMQRKGGDNGRDTANMLQFKINPIELFDNGQSN